MACFLVLHQCAYDWFHSEEQNGTPGSSFAESSSLNDILTFQKFETRKNTRPSNLSLLLFTSFLSVLPPFNKGLRCRSILLSIFLSSLFEETIRIARSAGCNWFHKIPFCHHSCHTLFHASYISLCPLDSSLLQTHIPKDVITELSTLPSLIKNA